MKKKKKPEQANEAKEQTSWSNPNYEHTISEVEALRAILKTKKEGPSIKNEDEDEINTKASEK